MEQKTKLLVATPLTKQEEHDITELYYILTPAFSLAFFMPVRKPIFDQLKKAKSKLEEMGI